MPQGTRKGGTALPEPQCGRLHSVLSPQGDGYYTVPPQGATGKFIQACGRWRSDAYKVYIEKSDTELARWSDKIAATGDLSLFGALTETGSLEMSMASMGDKPTYRGPAWV